ncbi:MAG: HD-GYP domain-containing protein [Gammaproteobacteria bacterium]
MRCGHCGKTITSRPYLINERTYCCERCYLMARDEYARQNDPYTALAEVLVNALDLREHETGMHSKRVACHTLVLARRLMDDPNKFRQIYWGALLHDIGKIGVSDAILLKRDALNDAEWKIMRTHPEKGYQLISQIPDMTDAAGIILTHEERYDGSGYPRGLQADQIPLGARLFMVIDALDAITSDRPYRKGESFDAAKAEIVRMAGSQFDPLAVDAFLTEETVLREMVSNKCHLSESL